MAITRGTLRLARQLRRDIGTEVDGVARTLTTAWVSAWDQLAAGWEQAASDLVAEAGRLEHWPRPTDIARLPRVITALDRSEQALDALAERTRTAAVAAAESVIDADVQYEPRIIASQAPATERAALVRHITGRRMVAEQDRDTLRLQVDSRIRTDAVNVMRGRAAGQITSDLLPLSDEASESMRRELIRGVDLGSNPRNAAAAMVANVEGRFNGGLTRALTVSRTEILDAYRGVSQQIHAANSDVVPGWQWLAELDLRTCPSCWAMHGQQFPVQQPGPDDHPQGRCARIPVLASWAELGISAPEPPSVMIDAEARFWALPEAQRLQIMGAGRLQLLADGRISFADLSTLRQNPGWRTSHAPTSLRNLRRRTAQPAAQPPPPAPPRPSAGLQPRQPEPDSSYTRAGSIVNDVTDREAKQLMGLHNSGRTGDQALGNILSRQGFDGKPRVVDRGEMDRLIGSGYTEVFRGLSEISDIDPVAGGVVIRRASELSDRFRTGDLYPGFGISGNGTYTSTLRGEATAYSDRSDGSVLRMGIRPNARVLEWDDVPDVFGDTASLRELWSDPGRMAAAEGYDVIHRGRHYVILNRTAAVVEEAGVDWRDLKGADEF